MRAALWFLGLFGVAVAIALFAGNNQGTVTLFWPPYRVDLSLNLVLMLLFAGFVFLNAALGALVALFAMVWLKGLPQGAARRTLALRMRLKAARLTEQTAEALETARLLSKH